MDDPSNVSPAPVASQTERDDEGPPSHQDTPPADGLPSLRHRSPFPGFKDGSETRDGNSSLEQATVGGRTFAWVEKSLFLLTKTNEKQRQMHLLGYIGVVGLLMYVSVNVHPHTIANYYRKHWVFEQAPLMPAAITLPGEFDDTTIEAANALVQRRNKRHAANHFDDSPDHCKVLREELVANIYALHKCTGNSDSKQYNICLPCVKQAIRVVQVLHLYKTATPDPNESKTCYEDYNEHHPKINVLMSTINNAVGESSEWVKGACFTCFEGNFQYRIVAPKVKKFLKVFTTWEKCLEKFEKRNSTAGVHPSCNECESPFKELLGMYMSGLRNDSLEATSDDICFDVESRYASALRRWNKELACPSHYHITNWQAFFGFAIIIPLLLIFLAYMLIYMAPTIKWFWFYNYGNAYQNELYYEEYMAAEEEASRERISGRQPSENNDGDAAATPIAVPAATEASRRKARNKKKDQSRRLLPETTEDAQQADAYYETNSFVPACVLLEHRAKCTTRAGSLPKEDDGDDRVMLGDDEATPPRLQQADGEKFLEDIPPNEQLQVQVHNEENECNAVVV